MERKWERRMKRTRRVCLREKGVDEGNEEDMMKRRLIEFDERKLMKRMVKTTRRVSSKRS